MLRAPLSSRAQSPPVRRRFLAGFPGFGGLRDGHVVRFAPAPALLQRTTIGEIDGSRTRRLAALARALRAAGFPVAASSDIGSWQKAHVAWVSPLADAVQAAGGVRRLAASPDLLGATIAAIRENLAMLDALGVPVTPRSLRLWQRLPARVVSSILRGLLQSTLGRVAVEPHARTGRAEMTTLAGELRALASRAGFSRPHADALLDAKAAAPR